MEVIDRRQLVLLGGRYPTRYFDVAIDFRWIRASKIIKPGMPPEQDKLSMGIIAAEEMTDKEFEQRFEEMAVKNLIQEANKIINPKKDEKT
jgi:hypothetical protein